MSRPSIYEFAGGEKAFLALATAHHERCLADPLLNHPFARPDVHPQHVQRLANYLGEVFGGPPVFSQTCGDHSAMLAVHAGNGIGDEFAKRFVACFVAAADDAGLPEDPEFRAALRSYMEWAMSEVNSYSPRGVHIPDGLSIPQWSWNGPVTSSTPMTS